MFFPYLYLTKFFVSHLLKEGNNVFFPTKIDFPKMLKISYLTTVKKLFKMDAFSLEAQETMSFQAWL